MSVRPLLILVGIVIVAMGTPAIAQEDPLGLPGFDDPPTEETTQPEVDGVDTRPLPTPGERAAPRKAEGERYKYWEEEGVEEVVVDDAGDIYRRRHYGGVIPSIRDTLRDKKTSKVQRRGPLQVTWIGFQQKALFSRVFIQTDRLPTYTIFKPDPLHIVIELPTARLRTPQEARVVRTHEFNSKVERIVARRLKRTGVQVVVTLKQPMGYLYKQEGNYVFIDIER